LFIKILASLTWLLLFAGAISAQDNSATATQSYNSLSEIAGKRNALLLIKKASILEASGGSSSMIEEVLKYDPRQSRRYRSAYNVIAGKLNKFMRKHKGMSAVGSIGEADYIIFFNLLEYRRPLGIPHPYGELFIIMLTSQTKARIVWKSKKVQWAGDAADDLINDLREIQRRK
jgi:hypothetical protein